MNVIALPQANDIFMQSLDAGKNWWRNSGTIGSIALHGALVVAVFGLTQHVPPPAVLERTIELVMAQPPQQPPQVKPEAQKTPAPPRPVVAKPAPVQRVAPVVADTPKEVTPPAVETAPPAPVAAPPQPAAPRVINTDGIPSDYVNQVYGRINAKTSYPRVAKMRGEEGRIIYKITLQPSGDLLKYEIKSSGNEALDKAAVDAIKAAAPFPKLPDLGGSAYVLTGAIVFALQ